MPRVESAELVRGWAGKITGSSSRPRASAIRAKRLGRDVRLAVEGEDEVAARLDPAPLQGVRALSRDRGEAEVGVVHDVADLVDAVRDPLGDQVCDGHVRGTEEQAREPVDEHPVQLLGHRPVEGAQAGLHVRDGDEQLSRGQRARERRVRVPEDEDDVGLLLQHHRLDLREHPAGLLAVRPRARLEPVARRCKLELLEEDGRKLRVVMLARVQHDLVHPALAEREGERGRLDELRPVADNGKDSHAAGECSRTHDPEASARKPQSPRAPRRSHADDRVVRPAPPRAPGLATPPPATSGV